MIEVSKKAIVLLSGGLDSATTAAYALSEGYDCVALTFNYCQKHAVEIGFARNLCSFFHIEKHIIIPVDPVIFRSALTSDDLQVPLHGSACSSDEIPITYVPARNILFLSYALALAESVKAHDIFIGVNAVDYSGYPDCRGEFIDAFNEMARVGTKTGVQGNPVTVRTPLIDMKKSEIIRKGIELGVDYSLTHSCYSPHSDGTSCGVCDSCVIRKNGFAQAGINDPTRYRDMA